MPRIELVKTTLVHKGFKSFVKIKVASEIEDYFSKASEGMNPETNIVEPLTELSSQWLDESGNGLTFYRKAKNLSGLVSNSGQSVSVSDSFGSSLLNNGQLNVAFLRIKGISEGVMVETTELLSGDSMRRFLKDLRSWIKGFYESELMNNEVEGALFVDLP